MKRILVIAGGEWQVALAARIKELGFETVVSNLYDHSPAFRYADFTEIADVRDKEANLYIAEKYHVDAVVTDESDIAVPTVAFVAEKLGLPSIGQDLAELFTNKYTMRKFCTQHGFVVPDYQLCGSVEEALSFFRKCSGRLIVKPPDSQSSRGVFTVESERDIREHFAETASFSGDGKSVLAEKYINGPEFTVDGAVIGGRHYSLAISIKKHYHYNRNVASELFFSHFHPQYDYDALRSVNNALVEAAGLPFGLTHAEYKYEDGQFRLVEIAARGGGTRISSHIVPLLTGIDTYSILIDHVLGEGKDEAAYGITDIRSHISSKRCAVLKFLDVKVDGEVVTDIEGLEEIRSDPHVLELRLEFRKGDTLHKAMDDRSRVGFYIAWHESEEELRAKMAWIDETLKIRVAE